MNNMLKLSVDLGQQLRQENAVVGNTYRKKQAINRSSRSIGTQSLFGFGKKKEKTWREIEREEQIKVQQEVLARRKSGAWQQEVRERRAKASRYLNDPEYKKKCDADNRAKFKAQREQEKLDNPEPKFGIIIPLAPFGMPEYDGGERFDLRLPYVDNGWVDEDADFFKNMGKLFGGGKKKNDEQEK